MEAQEIKTLRKKKEEIEQKHGVDLMTDARFMVELKQKLRVAKERLCTSEREEELSLRLDCPVQKQKNDKTTESIEIKNLKLTRREVETAAKPLVDKAVDLIKQALQEVPLNAKDINKVILVGGSSSLPGIQKGLRANFQREVIAEIQDPMATVALGAAVLAKKIRGIYCEAICGHANDTTATKCAKCGKSLKPDWEGKCHNICGYLNEPTAIRCARVCGHANDTTATECAKCGKSLKPDWEGKCHNIICGAELEPFIDRTHQHYGIEVLGGKFEIVMPKGTLCPTAKTVKRTFYTAHTGQRKIDVPIYQGDKEVAKDNAWQGILPLELPTGVPGDTPVDIFMSMNKNRLLEVKAECQGTRKSVKIKPSDWAWSLREKIEWADKMVQHDYTDPEIHRVSELVKQSEQVLSEWDGIAYSDSEESRRVGQEGKEVLAELERIRWRKQLQFLTQLFRRLLDYQALFESTLVELLQTTMETCQTAQRKPDEISKDQAEEELNRVFEKLFQDKVAQTLVIMILAFDEDSVDPNVREITDDLKIVNRLIEEKKVDAAKETIRRTERKPSFIQVAKIIFSSVELPVLLKSELGYGRDVETRTVTP